MTIKKLKLPQISQMFLSQSMRNAYLLLIIFLYSCASVMSPTGGDIDSVPPKLEKTLPSDLTGLSSGEKIILFFNEYIQEQSLKKAIEIFPSNNEKIKYEYKGNKIIVTLPSNLEREKTYIITLNSNFTDEHNVSLEEDIVIPFTLSNFINDGKINGEIYGSFTKPSILLWKDKIAKENMLNIDPDYILSGSKTYNFDFLPYGDYTILAIDKYNRRLDINQNIVSFSNLSHISIQKDITGKANFFFNEEVVEIELDSLAYEPTDEKKNSTLLGKVSGNFILPMIVNIANRNNSYSVNVDINGEFRIVDAVEGKYQLIAFQDRNNNQILDTGSFKKDLLSEKFSVYPDTLNLRSNWEIEITDWSL
jgi:hypothetical protein